MGVKTKEVFLAAGGAGGAALVESSATTTVRAAAGGRDEGGGPDLMVLSVARFGGMVVLDEVTDEPGRVALSTAGVASLSCP